MPEPLTVIIPHRLGREQAVGRLKSGIANLKPQLSGLLASIEDTWSGDEMRFRVRALAQTITGRILVMEDSVRVDVELPFLLRALAEKIRGRIQGTGTKMLEKK